TLHPNFPVHDKKFMEIWNQVDLSQWDGKAGEAPKAVKKHFTYADLSTGDDEMRAKAIDWLKAHAKDANPFFMYLCFLKVHNPNNPSPRFKGKSPGGGTYLDALMELDDNSGQVVQAIRDLGLAENTLVVWTTDNGAWIDAWPDAGYTPFRGMKGSSFEGGFRVPAIAWWPGHIKPGTVNMDMWSHMDWWPTFAKLAGLEPPPHDWKDNDGNPIIFDGIDLSESLLGTRPGKRDNFIYFNDQSFGGVRVKNFKALYTAKDTWLGQEQYLKIPALYDLWWDPGENYDIVFNGAAPTRGDFKTSPGRYAGQDNGWIGLYLNPLTDAFWAEMKSNPNIPYKPFGAGSYEAIPPADREQLRQRYTALAERTKARVLTKRHRLFVCAFSSTRLFAIASRARARQYFCDSRIVICHCHKLVREGFFIGCACGTHGPLPRPEQSRCGPVSAAASGMWSLRATSCVRKLAQS